MLAAYVATDQEGEWPEDWATVWTDTGAGQPLPADHQLAAKRVEVDQKVLANLMRLNHARAQAASETSVEPSPVSKSTKRAKKKKA